MPGSRVRLVLAALLIVIFVLVLALMRAANNPAPEIAPADVHEVQTQAVRTFISELTATAPAAATLAPTPIPRSSPTAAAALSGTPNCLGLRFMRDMTIPDNTEMTPAEVFTKTWLVENSGSCPWRPGFQVVLIGGLAMGGSPFKVAQTVGPGGSIQISIKMVAPTNQSGVTQGTWKMADADGVQFGDYLSVVIVVSGPTRIPQATATAHTAGP